ncbi:Diphosphomevalonate decarboxylase [Phytophthora fragariae]|uniref:diphosphomevalonate decarboxylase n=1 Tax=Phytophthora fragariae TaxID=53985 RepID=A0A6A3WXD2_9STRA|nr:Diphosphomevalonate decarboxylase [Phytophthora fragariae]KAE8930420.1 Diphosphomevalonate decarboxylase [Phytophthora fragariae]KAE8993054.1 Diphosphomevalonate decarboxylase [Phytophthora fragariae]KAE9091945.1 Diphosphomevalonate decarboxylase [Phytophthora fragariae]KAE9094906.1 Diphosphomevalonate decarboxylase [Phytophthora fragariae]
MKVHVATCSAPTNIAVIKYWGKDDVALNTPLNSSVSVTLHQDQLRTTTSVAGGSELQSTRLWLNGQEQPINKRVAVVLREMQQWAIRVHGDAEARTTQHLHIVSTNSFPTAAGLASSAAGYACLVAALAEFYGISKADEEFPGQLSALARQGSGSASRSLDGGFVAWQKGEQPDGRDSIAVQVADELHWPELCAVVCVVNDAQKDTSSTTGMQTTKATSPLLAYRAEHLVPERMKTMERAILEKDFEAFGTLTMQDSNQFHATCLDTTPPIFYLNDVSRQIIRLVHRYNEQAGRVQAAYTFDAGPNAVLFVEEQHVQELVSLVHHCFPTSQEMTIKSTISIDRTPAVALLAKMEAKSDNGKAFKLPHIPDSVKMIYVSRVGGGTCVLPAAEALVDAVTGEPLPYRKENSTKVEVRGCLLFKPSSRLPEEPVLRYLAIGIAAAAVTSAVLLRK